MLAWNRSEAHGILSRQELECGLEEKKKREHKSTSVHCVAHTTKGDGMKRRRGWFMLSSIPIPRNLCVGMCWRRVGWMYC